MMQPHEQRVIDERGEVQTLLSLTTRRKKALEAFFGTAIFRGLADDEQGRLFRQSAVMGTAIYALQEYAHILEARIQNFKDGRP
jgi:hypothetical protein